MNERQQRFIDLLEQIFELDKNDLDFGIYRILNIRRDEITKYFSEKLPQQIAEILKPFAMADTSALESDVYGALYSFFSRYYDEGDFISKRRYKEGVYAIPYEGEEVKLYWANQDQYYIKTSENFKDYTFLAGDYTVNFHLVDATTEQNNNKESDEKKRQFMLFTEDEANYPGIKTFQFEDKTLTIHFRFDIPDDPKKKYAEENLAAMEAWLNTQPDVQLRAALLANVSGNPRKVLTLIAKHLQAYVAKNSFDYFIHKDLGGFLSRELDFFIKNEIMHLDDIDTDKAERVETYLAKVRAVKKVGNEIIRFLAQMEDFQKKLWLKKKFVVETQWCITLDKIDESFYEEIRTNKAQVEEWKQMYAIQELQTDLEHTEPFTEVPSVLFLKQNQNLIVDTRHFSNDFKLRLVESIDNLDEQTNGIMFNADNFQALGLMQEKYNEEISATYIDPPYNTNASEIIYKNGYKYSSWNSLISNRVELGKKLLRKDGFNAVTIDYKELWDLGKILDELYSDENRVGIVTIFINPKGRQHEKYFASSTEYMLVYANDIKYGEFNQTTIDASKKSEFNLGDDSGSYRLDDFRRMRTSTLRVNKPKGYYPIYVSANLEKISDIEIEGGYCVYPISDDGTEYTWKIIKDEFAEYNKRKMLVAVRENGKIYIKNKFYEQQVFHNIWTDKKYFPEFNGTNLLKDILGDNPFSYPKSIYAVMDSLKIILDEAGIALDYFAGSGTTGHAVINLNREDNGARKYILVEMGEYFKTVTLPRVKKVIYAKDWKDTKPLQRSSGVSQILKYMQLESYEDALCNIELQKNEGIRNLFGEDYYINYLLDLEAKDSLLNIGAFRTPFNYSMKITEKNESKQRPVDVVETFNYLIGLNVASQGRVSSYNAQPAAMPDYTGAVDLKPAADGIYSFQQIDGKLRDGRRALIIWRTIGEDLIAGNAALDAYFQKYRINPQDREYDVIYVNGDNNIENLRLDNENWKVMRIEEVFNKKMFE